MSQTAYLIPQLHSFRTMPFTHVDTESPPTPPSKRKQTFPDPKRSPPVLRQTELPQDSSPILSRLKPNPYAANQMATIPQTQTTTPLSSSSSSTTPPAGRNNESLPSIRDILPEIGEPIPPTSHQGYGPESFRPSGPSTRPAATGLAPSSTRGPPYPTPEATPNGHSYQDRQYSGSMSSTSRNSPIQPFTSTLPHRSDAIRALPPLGFGSPESASARAGVYTSQSASSIPTHSPQQQQQSSLHWQNQQQYHPAAPGSMHYGGPPHGIHMQNSVSSPPYAHFDNSDYGSDGKSKRRRGNLPKQVTDTLRKWFNEHIAHPYPTEDEKMMLMSATNLTMSQISNWFINARRRSLPQHMPRDVGGPGGNPGIGPGPGGDIRDGMAYMSDRV